MRKQLLLSTVVAGALIVPAVGSFSLEGQPAGLDRPVDEARCGPGSSPETDVQGRVPIRDRRSGRSAQGYSCNLELLGQFQGEGSTWVSQSYRDCAYMGTKDSDDSEHPGVQVLDVSDPAHPTRVGTLTDPAMLGTWESLKVNKRRGLLAAVQASAGLGYAYFAVYDIKTDCAKPRLLNVVDNTDLQIPANTIGHEGNWSPDGRTYWSTSFFGGGLTAIDVTDPLQPKIIYSGSTSAVNHGFSVSNDGNRLYIAKVSADSGAPLDGNGMQIFDVSEVQAREPAPQIHEVGRALWPDGVLGQHTISISYDGVPYLVYVDELGAGAVRIFDLTDEKVPRVVSMLKLAIHMPRNADLREKDTGTAGSMEQYSETNGTFGYEAHYCDVDRLKNPTALACGYFQSGVRVFDIRNPSSPKEIAYFNPPSQVERRAKLESSQHMGIDPGSHSRYYMAADWCSSPPRFVGRRQLWVTCQDNGFLALRFTNKAYPLETATP